MGCGASSTAPPGEGKGAEIQQDSSNNNKRQLQKNASKLGTKKIVNSFIVAKTTMRKRESNGGNMAIATQDLGGRALEELKVISEDKSFRHPRSSKDSKSSGAQQEISFKVPCGLSPEDMQKLRDRDDVDDMDEPAFKLPFEDVEAGKAKLSSKQENTVLEGAAYFREQLAVAKPPTAQFCKTGVVQLLLSLLKRDDNSLLQHEAAWCIANMCAGSHEDCQFVADQGVVPELVRLLGSHDEDVVLKAVWALGNIAADCSNLQQAVVDAGALPPLLVSMKANMNQTALMRQEAWMLSNMLRPEPCADGLLEAIPALELLLGSVEDLEALTAMCWALSYMAELEEGVECIAKRPKLLRTLAYLVMQGSSAVMPALQVLGSACTGPAACSNVVAAGGISAFLTHMKRTALPFIKKECVWALSNIAVSGCENVRRLLDDGAFRDVADVLRDAGKHQSLMRECAYLLANPWSLEAKVNEELALRLIDAGLIQELMALLGPSTPSSILIVAIDGLQDALKKGQRIMMWRSRQKDAAAAGPSTNPVFEVLKTLDVAAKLSSLSGHDNDDVSMKVNGLVNVLQFM